MLSIFPSDNPRRGSDFELKPARAVSSTLRRCPFPVSSHLRFKVPESRRFIIIPAAGLGTRMGLPYPKQLHPFRGSTLIEHAVSLFGDLPVYVSYPESHGDAFRQRLAGRAHLVRGGLTRFESVRNAFFAIPDLADGDLVLIHDAARPFFEPAHLTGAWRAAAQKGAVIFASKAVDTIKRVDSRGVVVETLDRETIYQAQTPQIFRAELLRRAYEAWQRSPGASPTDEAGLVERCRIPVHVYAHDRENRKITHREDLNLLFTKGIRIGHGYDVHRCDPGRPLYLGGIHLPEGPGLLGHSDADVLIHALIDALLGAAGEGDIGAWFPDTDPRYKDIRSTTLLEKVWADLRARGFTLGNADLTVQAQAPRLAPHIRAMRENLSRLLHCSPDAVSIKATTTEGLGFVGRREGIAANAVVLLMREGGS